MKKTVALLLSLMLAAGVFASCGNKDTKEETGNPSQTVTDNAGGANEENAESDESIDTSAYTPEGIIDSIYAQKSPLFPIGFMPLDMSDKDSYTTYLGLEDVSVIKEAAVSESMMGSQAFSLVVARVNDGENAKEIAEKMKDGINPRKWICVGADDIKYTSVGDLICFCMISTEYAEDFTADDAINAFTKVVNGEAAYIEASEETIPEDFTEENIDVTDGEIGEETDAEEAPEESTSDKENNTSESKPAEQETPAGTQQPMQPAEDVEEPAEQPEANTPAEEPEEVPAEPENVPAADPENTPAEAPVETPEAETPEEAPEEAPAETPTETVSLEGIINKMYEIKMPEFMLGFIPVDMSDEFAYGTYLGINDPSKIAEAVVSEPMIGAQAYSLVVARVAPGQDANAIANEMKAGIDPRKWVCVEADDIKVTVSGDLICFCMISTDFADAFTAQDAMDAFKSVAK